MYCLYITSDDYSCKYLKFTVDKTFDALYNGYMQYKFETENQSSVFMGYTEGFLYHAHVRFEFLFVIRGALTVELEEKNYELRAGDILLVNPFERHAYHLLEDDTSAYFIMFPQDFTPQITDILSNRLFQQNIIRQSVLFEECLPLIQHIERHYNLKDYIMLQKDTYISGMITALLSVLEQRVGLKTFSSAKSQDLLFSVMNYLYAHFTEPLTTHTVAAEFHYSERHFAKLFRDATLMTLPNYINEIRLNNAIALMNDGETVIDAAFKSGFDSFATFHRTFKKRYGLPPRAYMNSIMNKKLALRIHK